MKRYKVVVSKEKSDFFVELMNRLGIRVEHESDEKSGAKVSGVKEKKGDPVVGKKEGVTSPQADRSIKDVLKKIEEMRGKH